MKLAIQVLDDNVELGPAACESAQRAAITQFECYQVIAGNDLLSGVLQRLAKLIDGPVKCYFRQVGSDRLAAAEDQVAGSALPRAEEKLFAPGAVTGHIRFSRPCVE